MILYDQEFKFVGISRKVLSLLGFKDMSDFIKQNIDINDLFKNVDNYSSANQDNFAWVQNIVESDMSYEYSFVKRKDGSYIEVCITGEEVFLMNSLEGNSVFYKIELFETIAGQKYDIYKTHSEIKPQLPLDSNNIFMSNTTNAEPKPTQKEIEIKPVALNIFLQSANALNNNEYEEILAVKAKNINSAHILHSAFDSSLLNEESLAKEKKIEQEEEKITNKHIKTISSLLKLDVKNVKNLLEEYIDYADSFDERLHEALILSQFEIVDEIVDNLKNLSDNLSLNPLTSSLKKLKEVTPDNAIKYFNHYKNVINSIRVLVQQTK